MHLRSYTQQALCTFTHPTLNLVPKPCVHLHIIVTRSKPCVHLHIVPKPCALLLIMPETLYPNPKHLHIKPETLHLKPVHIYTAYPKTCP
jgi:hypothetical protein